MNRKVTCNTSLFVLLILLLSFFPVQSQHFNPRLISMGGGKLVFCDRDNQLNVYDFADNPAGLADDQKQRWLKAGTWSDFSRGDFRREMDPQSQLQFNALAEGVEVMADSSVFRGFIQYYVEELRSVYRALEYQPYRDIFTPIDTTTGTFDYYGPKLGFEYGRRINSWLALGAQIQYRLQDGLKREPTKTKIDGRMIWGVIGANLTLHRKVSVALAFRPFSVQYRLNANKSFLLDYPVIYKFFGDSLLVKNENATTYDRTTRENGYGVDGAMIYRASENFIFAIKGGYKLDHKQIDEGSSSGKRDIDDYGSWQKQQPWAEAICRIRPAQLPLNLGIKIGWHQWDKWARTPRYQTVFEEMEGHGFTYGFGAAFIPQKLPFQFGVEYFAVSHQEEKRNYYQNYQWQRENNVSFIRGGGELYVLSDFVLRAGGATGKRIAEYHLSLDPVKFRQITLGSMIRINNVEVEITGLFDRVTPNLLAGNRDNFFLVVQITQWL